MGERPWGYEEIVSLVPGVASLKILRIKAGHKGRLQRHRKKDEAGHLLEGTMIVRWAEPPDIELKMRTLEAGESFHFPVGSIHMEQAVSDCTVLEVSTPYANDRVGMEETYGLDVPEDAMASTSPDEVYEIEPWF
jgi:quercetin dioxygenase-like cupin family protein